MSTPLRRVVITGAGIISPIGIGRDAFWNSIAEKRSGLTKVERLSGTALPHDIAGEIKGFSEKTARKEYFDSKDQKKSIKIMCREIQLGVASANLALVDGKLDLDAIDHTRLGVEFGANQMFSPPEVLAPGAFAASNGTEFQFDRWGDEGLAQMEPLWLLKYLPNMPACHIGIRADARGPNNSLTMAEASGINALAEAYRIISNNRADMMLGGSTGTRVESVKSIHARLWDELADYGDEADPATWCRPFDATRRGQVVGEGACTFIIEEESHAAARGAEILGTILGIGGSCVMDINGKADRRLAMVNAVTAALRDAGISPSEVGQIHAHGLGETQADIEETDALTTIFGDALSNIPVTALKSYIGNSGAACGTLELAASLLGAKHGVIPAVLNYSQPDENCRLNVVHGEHLTSAAKVILNLNVTAQGQAAAILVSAA